MLWFRPWTSITACIIIETVVFLSRHNHAAREYQLFDKVILILCERSYLVDGIFGSIIIDCASNTPMGSFHIIHQGLFVQIPFQGKLSWRWEFATWKLKSHLKAIWVNIVKVLHSTRNIIPNNIFHFCKFTLLWKASITWSLPFGAVGYPVGKVITLADISFFHVTMVSGIYRCKLSKHRVIRSYINVKLK